MTSLLLLSFFAVAFQEKQTSYDPSTTSGEVTIVDAEFEYDDASKVPLRVYLPTAKTKAPVILFSHGLGGSRQNNPYLGNHWAGRGLVVVFMQHAGSDENVWKDTPRLGRMKALKAAASKENFESRVADVQATLDQLKKWNAEGKKFAGRLDLEKIGMSGHSFGAVTTQAVSGQNFGRRGKVFTDERIKASIAMSPSLPIFGSNEKTFAGVEIPWMLMTGTNDKSIIASTTPESRLKVFQQLPKSGHFFQLVLDRAEHMAFSERTLSGRPQRNPKHHKAIIALSTAFWESYLKDDPSAKQWLAGEKVKTVLNSKDKWEKK